MKYKIIMNDDCTNFIGIHINMKLKYEKIVLKQTAGRTPTKIWRYKQYSLVNEMNKMKLNEIKQVKRNTELMQRSEKWKKNQRNKHAFYIFRHLVVKSDSKFRRWLYQEQHSIWNWNIKTEGLLI